MNTHIIRFFDGSKKEVSQKIADEIMEKSCHSELQGVKINGTFYKFSAISKILTNEDFFIEYPDERPEISMPEWIPNEQIRQPTTKAKELMKGGFIDYHLSQGRTPEEADKKWEDFIKAGLDYKISKRLKYA